MKQKYQQISSNVYKLNNVESKKDSRKRTVPKDYLADYGSAQELVRALLKYYHSRGYKQVKVWLEVDHLESGRKLYNVRSNITFVTPSSN